MCHDLEGNFVDANDAALNLLGYNKGDDKALNFSDLLDEEQMPLARKTVGLQLVTDLVQQVNGSIMLGKTHGTEFIVRF